MARSDFPSRVIVAQIGARMHYAVPALLHRAGLLHRLYTDVCAESGWARAMDRILPRSHRPAPLRRFLGRTVPEVPPEKIHAFSAFGVMRSWQRQRARSPGEALRHTAWANRRFCELVVDAGLDGAESLYAFNAAALEIARIAKSRSMAVALEQVQVPHASHEACLAEERRLWPGWDRHETHDDDWRELSDREHAEWQLADVILCGSQHVAERIRAESGPACKCVVVPYGVDPERFAVERGRCERGAAAPLRALCVATVGLAKGNAYLMRAAAATRMDNIRIRAVGAIQVSAEAEARLRDVLDLAGSVPRAAMRAEYAAADVFVLPSLSEGSATVCYEALAAGLPVITTAEAGSVVRDGIEGFIVPARDGDAIADRLRRLEADRDLLRRLSMQAVLRARQYSWDQYQRRLLEALGCETSAVV